MSCTECKGRGYVVLLSSVVPCLACGGAVPAGVVIDDRYPKVIDGGPVKIPANLAHSLPDSAFASQYMGKPSLLPAQNTNPFNIQPGDDIIAVLTAKGFVDYEHDHWRGVAMKKNTVWCPIDGHPFQFDLPSGWTRSYWLYTDMARLVHWLKEKK